MRDLAAAVEQALGRALTPAEPLAIAVSGGPDSVALLRLAAAAFPGRVTALTVDHGLRRGAAAEAATVAAQCADAGVPHATLAWTGPKPAAGLQGAAREARYALLAGWCASQGITVLMTAHHADDQAETLLMRLARASGSSGLAGIRPCRALPGGVMLVRPLLDWRRDELAPHAAGWRLADDPANRDPRHFRTRARALLAATPWLDAARLADAAAHLGDAEAALAWAADRAWAGSAVVTGDRVTLDVTDLPAELVQRLLRRALAAVVPAAAPRGPALVRLAATLAAGGTATLAGVRARGGPVWTFGPAPARRDSAARCG